MKGRLYGCVARSFALRLMAMLMGGVMLLGCDDVFHEHPYAVNVRGERNINERNIEQIQRQCAGKDTLRVAFISDTHQWLDDSRRIVRDINRRDSVDFVLHLGDLTDTSTELEFEWSRDVLLGLNKPWVALIGNHDFLATGFYTYKAIYGKENLSFIAGRHKFVCLNTNATEYDYMAAVPDFDYMQKETEPSVAYDRTVVCMHAPPFSDQFNNNVVQTWQYFVKRFPGLQCCVNGHGHGLDEADLFNDGVIYYEVPSAERRIYLLFTFTPDGYDYEVVRL